MNCNVRYNTKQHLMKKGMVDENMIITTAMFFDENNKLSDLARRKYGVENQGKLYKTQNVGDKKVKAVENTAFFDELQKKHENYSKITDSKVSFQFRAAKLIGENFDKIIAWESNRSIPTDVLWKKIQQLGIPTAQIETIKEQQGDTVGQKLASFLANYSYTIEINTTKEDKIRYEDSYSQEGNLLGTYPIEEGKTEKPTQYYSKLTVPGGVKYTEQEIATPAIVPSIKGHAQFATDKGIGWFRSDETPIIYAGLPIEFGSQEEYEYNKNQGLIDGPVIKGRPTQVNPVRNIKTRRILEVQSDLFQKGRDKANLIGSNLTIRQISTGWIVYNQQLVDAPAINFNTLKEAEDYVNKVASPYLDKSENKFLQFLNKDNNWVTFFIKSIIQDSAKKGYEKVLFPKGDTAAKVEGHTTLEEFKKQKEDRIKELKTQKNNLKDKDSDAINAIITDFEYERTVAVPDYSIRKGGDKFALFVTSEGYGEVDSIYDTLEEAESVKEELEKAVKSEVLESTRILKSDPQSIINKKISDINNEITQLEQEIERVEKEGFGALKPIYNFYENTVGNILNKNYKVKETTDEYGNSWYEINIDKESAKAPILFQKKGFEGPKLSPKVLAKVKDFLKKIGVDIKKVDNIVIDGVQYDDANAVALMTKSLIEYTEGNEDALTEEAMHFAVEILEQTNPALFNQMLSRIADYEIYDQVFDAYKQVYKNKDGSPNIRAIKKEAIGQLLAEMYITKEATTEDPAKIVSAQNWFEKVINWIKTLFLKNKELADPFMEALKQTEREDFSADVLPSDQDMEAYFQLTPRQRKDKFNVDEFINQLLTVHNNITPPIEEKRPDGTIDSYYMYNGKRIPKRVTDLIKQKMKDYIPTDEDEIKRSTGTKGHADLHEIFKRYVDEKGYRRETPLAQTLPSQINPHNNDAYEALEKALVARLDSYAEGTRFLSELRIYNGTDTAGTIDFMAIEKDGTIDMLDWKFIEIVGDQKSILKAKVESYQLQMGEYKNMLSETYGVPKANYRLTAMVPIQTVYNWNRATKTKKFSKVKVGNVDYKAETNPVLLPIATADYDTGSEDINELIKQLNNIAQTYIDRGKSQENKAALKEKISNFLAVIRQLQMQKDATKLMKNTKEHINELFLERERLQDAISVPGADLKELSERLIQNRNILITYSDMDAYLEELFKGDKELRKEANAVASEAKRLMNRYNKNIDKVTELMGTAEGIKNVNRPEKELGFTSRLVRSFSNAQTKTAQLFYRLYQQAQQAAAFATDKAIGELSALNDELKAYAKTQGMSEIELFDKYLLRKHEYGGETYLRLIQRYDSTVMTDLRKALDSTDKRAARKMIEKYVNMEEYMKDYELQKERVFKAVDKNTYSGDEASDLKQKKAIKEKWEAEHNLTKNTALVKNNSIIFTHLNQEAFSDEFKTLQSNPVMYKVYQAQIQANKRAKEIGLLPANQVYTFYPNIRKQYIDRVVQGGDKSILTSILNSVKIDPGSDNVYGAIDPITKQSVMSIPKAFVYDLPESQKSRDAIKVMALWEREINEYKWKAELEGAAQVILDTERRKEILRPNADNKNQLEATPKQSESDKNTEYLKNFINYYIYNKKMTGDSTDFTVEVDMKSISEKVNKKVGFNLLPKYEGDDAKMKISFTKLIQSANRWFQMKTLGFNLTSPISNLTGGLSNAMIMSGQYFKPEEYRTNTLRLTSMLTGEQGKVYAAMIDYFMPLVENQENVKIGHLSSNKITELMTSEVLFMLQRGSDKMVSYPMLLSMLENTAVINGQLVNIPEYVRKEKGYYSRFYLSKEERTKIEQEVEAEIVTMKQKSVAKTAKIVNGELVIEGVNRADKTVWELRNKVQSMAKKIMGASSPEDIAQYRMSLFGQSFMMFKNWIPGMALARFGDISYNVGIDNWEYGRLRLMYKLLWENGTNSLTTLRDVMQLNENGVKYMQQVYDQKLKQFEEAGGTEDEFMTEEEFLEMHHRAIKMAVKETQYWLGLLSAFVGFTLATGDDDKDEYRGARAFISRAFDKSKDELGFFFSPLSAMDIANGSVFPALGTVNDALKFMSHFGKEIGGAVFGVEDWTKEAKPTKYLFKTFPVTKEMLTMIAVFYPELADEMGIKISNNYSVR